MSIFFRNTVLFHIAYGNEDWYNFLKETMLCIRACKNVMPFEVVKPLLEIYSKEITLKKKKTSYTKMILFFIITWKYIQQK